MQNNYKDYKNLSLYSSGLCGSAILGSESYVATDYIIFITSVYRQVFKLSFPPPLGNTCSRDNFRRKYICVTAFGFLPCYIEEAALIYF